ncbi:NADH-quinone oxidoreductase subunit NuoK [Alphaproteobacteria bacterium]|nr:NADH-quinone oxidoreductase subunit NuoK [Alphaproteobacteria bacterium]
MAITLTHCIGISSALFAIGLFGMLANRRSLISVLMSLELLLLGVNLTFVSFGHFHQDLTGQILALFVLTIAAAETAIGLSILVIYYRQRQTIHLEEMSQLSEVSQ